MFKTTGSRLALALLGYVVLIILVLTFNPFYLTIPDQIRIDLETNPAHLLDNVFLFLPFGFLYRLTTKRRNAWLLGAGLSLCIELGQIFFLARGTSPFDVLTNTLGTGLGAVFYDLLAPRLALTPKMIGRLRLETPLMSFVYLLIPLLWVNGLTLAESGQRWPLTFLIGLSGAVVFSAVYRHWLEAPGLRLTSYTLFSTGVWFLLGMGSNLRQPFPVAWVMLAVVLIAASLSIGPRRLVEQRFEQATVRWLIPIFALYLVLLALWPLDRALTAWHGVFGLTDQIQANAKTDLMPHLEYVAAFSILGYLTAEWRGRLELTIAQDFPGLLIVAGGGALALEFLAGFQTGMGASLVRGGLATLAALYGGVIYHFLRAHLRFLCGRSAQRVGT